jgi:RHS repeat-associated protein
MTNKPNVTMVWDARNHLVQSVKSAQSVGYKYDAFGNRVSKGDARYLLVDNQVVAEYTGSASKQYSYGSYIDEVLAEKGSEIAYYHRNRQYNTVALTDAVGAIVEQYSTDAMGRVKAFDAAAVAKSAPTATKTLFTGRTWDAETGLYYFRARYFEPELGVFVSRDPLGFVDGMGVYQGWFVLGLISDPHGLCNCEELTVGMSQQGFEYKPGDTNTFDTRAGVFDKNYIKFRSGEEIIDGLINRSKICCIKDLRFFNHGWDSYGDRNGIPGSQGLWPRGVNPPPDDPNPQNTLAVGLYYTRPDGASYTKGGRGLIDLALAINKKQVKFCKPCQIVMYGCSTGEFFARWLSQMSGCKVYFAKGASSPVVKGGVEIPGQGVSDPPGWHVSVPSSTPGGVPTITQTDPAIGPSNTHGTNTLNPAVM